MGENSPLRPGIVLGAYPERDAPRTGRFEQLFDQAMGTLRRQWGGPSVPGTPPRRSIYLQRKRNSSDEMLQVLDAKWKEHLAAMDYLRQSVGLRGYAQKNPKQEYKREAFELFEGLLHDIRFDVVRFLARDKKVLAV